MMTMMQHFRIPLLWGVFSDTHLVAAEYVGSETKVTVVRQGNSFRIGVEGSDAHDLQEGKVQSRKNTLLEGILEGFVYKIVFSS